jgi:hypothetical protein
MTQHYHVFTAATADAPDGAWSPLNKGRPLTKQDVMEWLLDLLPDGEDGEPPAVRIEPVESLTAEQAVAHALEVYDGTTGRDGQDKTAFFSTLTGLGFVVAPLPQPSRETFGPPPREADVHVPLHENPAFAVTPAEIDGVGLAKVYASLPAAHRRVMRQCMIAVKSDAVARPGHRTDQVAEGVVARLSAAYDLG